MKKFLLILPIVILVAFVFYFVSVRKIPQSTPQKTVDNDESNEVAEQESVTAIANPASVYCEENGGKLEIVTNKDGSQFGMCQLKDYSCEEWTHMNGGCTIEEDEEKIKDALIAKGLNLTGMKVVIHKHLGKHISGGVVPVEQLGGGGYVFAAKDMDGNISIVADGQAAIMCTMLQKYQDFPAYLIPECVNENGSVLTR